MELSADKQSLRVDFHWTLDARGVERLIHELALTREKMDPPVPRDLDAAIAADAPALMLEPHSFTAKLLPGGTLLIALRHGGLGFLCFELTALEADLVAALVRQEVPNRGGSAH